MLLLPERPCDVYVEGILLKSGVSNSVKIVTPNLPGGTFKYAMKLKDSADPTKVKDLVVTGIVAGGNLTVDARNRDEVASL